MNTVITESNYTALLRSFRMYNILAMGKDGKDRMISGVANTMQDLFEAEKQRDGFEVEMIHFSKSEAFTSFGSCEARVFQNDQDTLWELEFVSHYAGDVFAIIRKWRVSTEINEIAPNIFKKMAILRTVVKVTDLTNLFQMFNEMIRVDQ